MVIYERTFVENTTGAANLPGSEHTFLSQGWYHAYTFHFL
jgi:hypothetical protein